VRSMKDQANGGLVATQRGRWGDFKKTATSGVLVIRWVHHAVEGGRWPGLAGVLCGSCVCGAGPSETFHLLLLSLSNYLASC
jgi:hypothetical protein